MKLHKCDESVQNMNIIFYKNVSSVKLMNVLRQTLVLGRGSVLKVAEGDNFSSCFEIGL